MISAGKKKDRRKKQVERIQPQYLYQLTAAVSYDYKYTMCVIPQVCAEQNEV